jgi:site-specific recombinase XerD
MGQIRNINGVYYIEFHARGLLYSQIAGKSMEQARKLLLQVEEKIAGGEALTISRHIELPDFFDRFLTDATGWNTNSPITIKRFNSVISHFSGFLEENFPQVRQLAQITPAILETYKAYLAKTQKVKIVNLTILLVRDMLDFGIKLGFLNDNPSLHVRLFPWPRSMKRKATARYEFAGQLIAQGAGLSKLAQLLKLPDISRAVYFADLIPLSREDVYR